MEFFVKRKQAINLFGRPIFKLHAQIELNDEEVAIYRRYGFRGTKLYVAEQPHLLRECLQMALPVFLITLPGVFLFFTSYIGLAVFSGQVFPRLAGLALICALGAGAIAAFLYFHFTRQSIYVADLVSGRNFKCKSVMDLVETEQGLQKAISQLAYVMETSALWGGRHQVDIPVFDPGTFEKISFKTA